MESQTDARYQTFCPATMCPLFAKDGSPWTGEKNHLCVNLACGWFDVEDGCQGAVASFTQVGEVEQSGRLFQLGPVSARRLDQRSAKTFDCPRAHECQWQIEYGEQLCPPRHALSLGIDPRVCAY
jgi:hypothetical protein